MLFFTPEFPKGHFKASGKDMGNHKVSIYIIKINKHKTYYK